MSNGPLKLKMAKAALMISNTTLTNWVLSKVFPNLVHSNPNSCSCSGQKLDITLGITHLSLPLALSLKK